MKSSLNGIILGCAIAAFFAVVSYLGAERAMLGKIRSDIQASVGQDYAILALHMGGNDFKRPSLWEMLKLVFLYETNLTGEYSPQGSGGYTGKKHYLALLISDNNEITFCEWSFRNWGLVFDQEETRPWDVIDLLSEADQPLYRYNDAELEKRGGLKCINTHFNDEQIRFYYRKVKEGYLTVSGELLGFL